MDEREMFEEDRARVIQRAEDLMIDQPGLTAAMVLTILDDEFKGSYCYPGATASIVTEIDSIWKRTRPITG